MTKTPFVPVIAVLNMKGGVGKTTISTNLFRRLFEEKVKSCILLDLDPQFNLTQALFKRAAYEKLKLSGKTIASVFDSDAKAGLFEVAQSKVSGPEPVDLETVFWSFSDEKKTKLTAVPGDFSLVRYSLMDDQKKLNIVKTRFKDFVEKCKLNHDIVVLDCNPSSSFLTICALSVCTHILVPVRLDKYSVLGLQMLWEFVNDYLPIDPKPEFVVVLNGYKRSGQTKAMKETEAELRGHAIFGSKTLANTIRETGQLVAKTDYTGFSVDRKTNVRIEVRNELNRVASELATKVGLK